MRARGAVVSRDQALLAMAGVLLYDARGALRIPSLAPTATERYKVGATLSGLALSTVREHVARFRAAGALALEPPHARGPRPRNEAALNALDGPVRSWVAALLRDRDSPTWITRRAIQDFIHGQCGVRASFKRITGLCRAWGLEYGAPAARAPGRR